MKGWGGSALCKLYGANGLFEKKIKIQIPKKFKNKISKNQKIKFSSYTCVCER